MLWETLATISERRIPTCDRLPTHEPTEYGWYLCHRRNSNKIELFISGSTEMDYPRGWIFVGDTPTVHSICASMARTYLSAVGLANDGPYWSAIMNGVENASAVEMQISNPDAFIFEDSDGHINFAVYEDGLYWDMLGREVKPTIGVPVVLRRRDG